MRKSENLVSVVLGLIVFFAILAIQRRWQVARLEEAASSILATAGMGEGVPNIEGYDRLRTYELGDYRAGLYRVSPAPLVFASYRFVIYDRRRKPVFTLQSVEASKDPWTVLYDFAGRRGLRPSGSRSRPVYTRSLTGEGTADIIIGQYSGGDHCCTVATVVELGKDSVRVIGHIEGLGGLPFEGLELRRIDADPAWEILAHRPYSTICGPQSDAPDVLSVYDYAGGAYADHTSQFSAFLDEDLRHDLERWEKAPSLQLLQTIAIAYERLGQRNLSDRFLAMNLGRFARQLRERNVDPNTCMDDVSGVADRVATSPRE